LKIIWVLENIKKDNSFYSKFNILLLLSSVTLWKKHYPEDNCVFYCDELTYTLFKNLDILKLWNEVIIIEQEYKINREVFWAASKVEVLAKQNEEVILMDHDTLVFKPIKKYLGNKVTVTNLENGYGYYPTSIDPYIKKLSYKPRWQPASLNVSFLHLPFPYFTQKYTQLSLKIMEELTELEAPNAKYLIFAEQLLLRHLLDNDKIPYQCILKDVWDCDNWKWNGTTNKGLFKFPESELTFKHYGPLKDFVLSSKGGQNYEHDIKLLENCINLPNLDLSSIDKK
jgi:hypothetical protein|tara:strand:+ start:801 stop:1652 length:852 start_codon:yes stop_codon:yes gene_type:complete